MDRELLNNYIDACELVRETEKDIQRLRKKRETIIQTNVSGSNPDFPYEPKHFKVMGTVLTYREDSQLRLEEKLLQERKEKAKKLKMEVEEWMLTVPVRMQRIIRYRFFKRLTWEQTAERMGKKATGESVRKEFDNFLRKK